MICAVDDCTVDAIARGWCNRHYRRWQRYGDPTVVSNPTGRPRKQVCVNGHPLTVDNVYTSRSGKRQCRTCLRHRSKMYNRKRRAAGQTMNEPAEWHRQYRAEVKAGIRTVTPRPQEPAVPMRLRILDLLCIEDGWWEPEEMADRLNLKAESLKRVMYRLEQEGLTEHRVEPLRYRATAQAHEQVA